MGTFRFGVAPLVNSQQCNFSLGSLWNCCRLRVEIPERPLDSLGKPEHPTTFSGEFALFHRAIL